MKFLVASYTIKSARNLRIYARAVATDINSSAIRTIYRLSIES